jgi:uncharacterized phage protein (predicted DNA packaging)
MYIPLELAKKHLQIEMDYRDDDEYIMGLIGVAEDAVRTHVNEGLDDIAERNGGCIPAPLFQAMLLMIGQMYQNREIIGAKTGALPFNYQYLIDLYRNYNN